MLFVIYVILACGLIGGTAKYFVQLENPESKFQLSSLAMYALLGVVAAAIVPLFLEVVSVAQNGGLITDLLKENEKSEKSVKLLVLVGFCLLASFYSRGFIQNVAEKTIFKANKALEGAASATKAAEGAIEDAMEAKEDGIELAAKLGVQVQVPTGEELTILQAMERSEYKRLWPVTIASDTGRKEDEVKAILRKLETKGLVQQRRTSQEGHERWRIRSLGYVALQKEPESEKPKDP